MYLPVLLPRSRIRQCHVSQRGQLDLGCGVTTNLRSGGCKTLPICSTTRIRAVWPSYQWSCSAGPPPPNRQGERAVASPLDDVGGSVAPSLRLLVYSQSILLHLLIGTAVAPSRMAMLSLDQSAAAAAPAGQSSHSCLLPAASYRTVLLVCLDSAITLPADA
jgi:hypothetical protein